MNQISTFNFETILVTLSFLLFIIIVIEIKFHFLSGLGILERIGLVLVGIISSLFSFVYSQSYLSGTGMYTRNGYPIAYVQSGNWDILKLTISIILYVSFTYIVYFIVKKIFKRFSSEILNK